MGCVCSDQTSNNKGTKQLKSMLHANRKSKVSGQCDYVNLLFQKILSNNNLNILLHKSIFEELIINFNHNYWSKDEAAALIRLLENYIKYSIFLVSDEIKNDSKYHDELSFGEIFGSQVYKLENQVKMKCHWMLQILSFSQQFYRYTFNLQDQKQILQMIGDVKSQCEKNMLSMFYISSYFVKCCQKLQKQGKSTNQICEILNKQSNLIKQQYGAEAMKKKEDAIVARVEQNQQAQKIKKYTLDSFKPIIFMLDGNANKQQQLQNQIMQMVYFAKQSLSFFNDLLYSSCTQNQGFGFKSNLKLSSKQNKSSLLRVKQKMLKKLIQQKPRSQQYKQKCNLSKTIEERIKIQEQYVQNLMKQIYEQLDCIPFNVSDLLRGKCLFNKISHINKAANCIIQKIKLQKQSGKDIDLTQIDNRLNGKTKDLVFKIKIGDLICQFQFAMLFKQVQNQIDHKMYEIGRSKIFSQIFLLYQWNKKSVKQYFDLMTNILQHVNENKLTEVLEKYQKLTNFLGVNPIDYKKKDEQTILNINQLQKLQNLKKINFNEQKINKLKTGCKLRSLLCLFQQNKLQKILALKDINICQQNDQYTVACQQNIIGSTYKNLGKYEQALEYYKKSLQKKNQIKGSKSLDYAQVLNNIGLIYVNTQKYAQALEFYEQSLMIKKQIKGQNSIQYAQTLNNIGLMHDNQKNYNKALEYYNRSLVIKINVKGNDCLDCAQTLNNIGLVNSKMSKYAQAIDYLTRSLSIKQKIKGKNSMECAQTLNNLGAIYQKIKKYQQAQDYFQRALEIKKKIKGAQSIDCAQTITNIGLVHQCNNQYEKALQYYQKALEIKKKINGIGHSQCLKLKHIIELAQTKAKGIKPQNIKLNIQNLNISQNKQNQINNKAKNVKIAEKNENKQNAHKQIYQNLDKQTLGQSAYNK